MDREGTEHSVQQRPFSYSGRVHLIGTDPISGIVFFVGHGLGSPSSSWWGALGLLGKVRFYEETQE